MSKYFFCTGVLCVFVFLLPYFILGETGLFTETTSYDPNSPYSASKASLDHFVRAYGETYDLPYLIINCSNNYGLK